MEEIEKLVRDHYGLNGVKENNNADNVDEDSEE